MPEWIRSPWIVVPVVMILAAFLLVWRVVERKPDRAGQRIGLWIAALVFTFYGPFSAVAPTWPPTVWAEAINAEKDFKDLWLAMIAMMVFSISNIADNLIREHKDISKFIRFLTPIILALYFGAIGMGMAQYKTFSGNVLTNGEFDAYWTIVWGQRHWVLFGNSLSPLNASRGVTTWDYPDKFIGRSRGVTSMTFAEVIADSIKVLLSVSVLGVIGKLGFPQSWLFRSYRPEPAQPSAGSVGTRFDQAVAWSKLSSLSLEESQSGKFGIKSTPAGLALSVSQEKIVDARALTGRLLRARVSRALEAQARAFQSLAEEQTKRPSTAIEIHAAANWENSTVIAGEHHQELRYTKNARVAEELPPKAVLGATKLDEKSARRSSFSLKLQASKTMRPVEA